MKIEVEFPFNIEFSKAYLSRSNADFRQRVSFIRDDKTGTLMSYARYLMSVKLGRFLSKDEEVDHINTDPTDDSIENLQVLSVEEHRLKSIKENECEKVKLTCACCGIIFDRPARIQKYKSPKNVFCSYSCNGKFYANKTSGNLLALKNKKITEDDMERMRKMIVDGLTGYRISKEIGKVGTSSTMRWIRIIEEKYGVQYKHWKN